MEMPCDMRINNKTKQMSAGILYTVIVLFRTENYHEIVEIRFYHLWEIMDSVSRPHIDQAHEQRYSRDNAAKLIMTKKKQKAETN